MGQHRLVHIFMHVYNISLTFQLFCCIFCLKILRVIFRRFVNCIKFFLQFFFLSPVVFSFLCFWAGMLERIQFDLLPFRCQWSNLSTLSKESHSVCKHTQYNSFISTLMSNSKSFHARFKLLFQYILRHKGKVINWTSKLIWDYHNMEYLKTQMKKIWSRFKIWTK